ncbi:MAG TPA: hypothetical protein VNS19_12185 [Acidimicrobiales bacterium]|nr:hypothetical protein [Acidimicrobiales bacterium]
MTLVADGPRRAFTDDELADLALGPRAQVEAALASGRPEDVRLAVEAIERDLGGQIDRYTHWISTLFAFVGERHGAPGSAAAIHATRSLFAAHPDVGEPGPTLPEPVADEVAAAAAEGDVAAALGVVDRSLARWRTLVDLYRDWISALLTDVYRRHGADELEAAHRRVGEATMRNLTAAVDGPFKDQASGLVRLLTAHFSEVELHEDDDKLTIVQDPCGTCGRQVAQGRHQPPLDLAVVTDEHLTTWGRGATTVYRTHVPVWHVALAGEALGGPWPVNQCPHGEAAGPCTILLYKDPRNPDALADVPGPTRLA